MEENRTSDCVYVWSHPLKILLGMLFILLMVYHNISQYIYLINKEMYTSKYLLLINVHTQIFTSDIYHTKYLLLIAKDVEHGAIAVAQ